MRFPLGLCLDLRLGWDVLLRCFLERLDLLLTSDEEESSSLESLELLLESLKSLELEEDSGSGGGSFSFFRIDFPGVAVADGTLWPDDLRVAGVRGVGA